MKWRAEVEYLRKRAQYEIYPDAKGIYQARLVSYEGGDILTPPQAVTLVRSIRKWAGSHEERPIIDALGAAIDNRVRGSHPHDV